MVASLIVHPSIEFVLHLLAVYVDLYPHLWINTPFAVVGSGFRGSGRRT